MLAVVMTKKGDARTVAGAATSAAEHKRRRRRRRPWGNLLGGKPIERSAYFGAEKVDLEDTARLIQYEMMVSLVRHYGIRGPVPTYPFAGVGDVGGWLWYQLALAIASELDDSLKIIDAKRPGKTAPRWRGVEGRVLVRQIEALRKIRPHRSFGWCLYQLRAKFPTYYGAIPSHQLKARYYEARKRQRGTKRSTNN